MEFEQSVRDWFDALKPLERDRWIKWIQDRELLYQKASRDLERPVDQGNEGLAVRFSRFLNDHRLLPQSWIAGFLYTYIGSLSRKTYPP